MPNPPPAPQPSGSTWYADAMEQLVGVVQELSQARTVDAVAEIVRRAARRLTGADGATFVLREGDQCYYADEDAIAPLWKGHRFPMSACISGWVMLHGRSAVIEDIYADPRIPADAYRPTFVKSLAMVPIRRSDPIGSIGNYWAAKRTPTTEEVAVLQALADTASVALQNAELYGRLREQVRVLQQQRERIQQQHDSIEVFARALAHDLKEPVRTMQSFSRLALDPAETPHDRERSLRFIQDASDRMGLLVDSVLRYMQLDGGFTAEGCADSCNVAEALAAAARNIEPLIRERRAVIEHGELPTINAHPGHITQVLQHLIANAVRHNDRAVTVCVSAQSTPEGWAFTVRDNGRGVPAEHAAKIFLPFKRLAGGDDCAGLGLAVCEKIVTRYRGTIRCESAFAAESKEGGAAFIFTWPNPTGQMPAAAAAPQPTPAEDERLACVLLVDDMPADLMLSKVMLARKARLNCRVLTAEDGAKALDVLRREKVDLVLLDINMPNVDGFEALERIRSDKSMSRIAVIMCTGSDYEKDKQRAQELGAVGYVLKPASFDKLVPLIESIPTLRLTRQQGSYNLHRAANAAA